MVVMQQMRKQYILKHVNSQQQQVMTLVLGGNIKMSSLDNNPYIRTRARGRSRPYTHITKTSVLAVDMMTFSVYLLSCFLYVCVYNVITHVITPLFCQRAGVDID